MNLIQEGESLELFEIQNTLLKRLNEDKKMDDIVRLSLLQTLSPIEDYNEAKKILIPYIGNDSTHKLEIIGAYWDIIWFFEIDNLFLQQLKIDYDKCDNKIKSIIYYLEALYHDFQGKDCITDLRHSIRLCNRFSNNYSMLSKKLNTGESEFLYRQAMANTVFINPDECFFETWDLISPENYIDEFITGVVKVKDIVKR